MFERIINNKEVKNAGWIIGGKILQLFISFVVSVFTARYLGPSNYGLINYAGAYIAFFSSLCNLGINGIIIKNFVDNPNEIGKTIGTTLILRILSSFISTILIVCMVYLIDHGENTTVVVTFLCSIALIFQVFDTFNYWFQSKYESRITAIATLTAYIATSIYRLLLLITHRSVGWFAFATSIDYICLGIVLLLAYKKNGGPSLCFSVNKAKELLSNSYHYILSGMMVAIYGQTDKVMLKQMLDEKSVGYYSLASSINNMWVFVLGAIITSMYPTILQLYNIDKKEFDRKNRQLYSIVIYLSIFVAVCIICFGKLFVTTFYGDEYIYAVSPLNIITWYTIFSYLGVARNAWIVCENKQKYLKYMYLTAAGLNIILNFGMIPLWGVNGAAMASLITQISTSIVIPLLFREMRPNVKLIVEAFLLRGVL